MWCNRPRYANVVDFFTREINESVLTSKEKTVVRMQEEQPTFKSCRLHVIRGVQQRSSPAWRHS